MERAPGVSRSTLSKYKSLYALKRTRGHAGRKNTISSTTKNYLKRELINFFLYMSNYIGRNYFCHLISGLAQTNINTVGEKIRATFWQNRLFSLYQKVHAHYQLGTPMVYFRGHVS